MKVTLSHDVVASLLLRAARSSHCTSNPISSQNLYYRSNVRSCLRITQHRYASSDSKPTESQPTIPPTPTASRYSHIPLPTGAKTETFEPKPLAHPIGLPYPPEAEHNTGLDPRTFRERHRDFTNYDRHLQRRQQLKTEFAKPYFRDWTMLRHSKGKSFIANQLLFKGEKSGWFPNLWGETLSKEKGQGWLPKLGWNTTQVFQGNVNVVAIFSGLWAEKQVKTFVDDNSELMELLDQNRNGLLRLTRINIEDNWLRRSVVKAFKYRLRSLFPEEEWARYFIVDKSIRSQELKDAIGFLNSKVGYVYLVDSHCRIRWAGSGHANPQEAASLVVGAKRLLEETKKEIKLRSNDKSTKQNV
ncbi:putative f1f0 atp synthase assembly protein atp10 [Phaeomoniella chlamydospora]|uniref:Putative f1f0 atp synthase assembly protein atp10 n=1 Tax=Phaeomoniella chlamydospora TaxID=158046 RepID=A0A0G2GT82_PHACM|nr:putative f1f0 atp synthase assembly protein atp10 [Phaeomoniella chlamydospora]